MCDRTPTHKSGVALLKLAVLTPVVWIESRSYHMLPRQCFVWYVVRIWVFSQRSFIEMDRDYKSTLWMYWYILSSRPVEPILDAKYSIFGRCEDLSLLCKDLHDRTAQLHRHWNKTTLTYTMENVIWQPVGLVTPSKPNCLSSSGEGGVGLVPKQFSLRVSGRTTGCCWGQVVDFLFSLCFLLPHEGVWGRDWNQCK